MSTGLNLTQVGVDSLFRYRRDYFFAPIAATTNQLVTTVDPSGMTAGDNFTLVTYANGLLQRRARLVTMTIDDDDVGGGLSVTARITGQRWGQFVSEIVTKTAVDGTAATVTSVNVYDEVTEIKLLAKTADAGDAVFFGIDGTGFGLDFPIDNVADVLLLDNVSTNTEQAQVAITSTVVQAGAATGGSVAGGSYIKGITLATTDRWEVRYLVSRKVDTSGTTGAWR